MSRRRWSRIASPLLSLVLLVGPIPAANPAANPALIVAGEADDGPRQIQKGLPKGSKIHRVQAGEPGKDGWYEAKSTEGHFRVFMPIPFNDATIQASETPSVRVYLIGSKSEEGFKFSAHEIEAKAGKQARIESMAQDLRNKGDFKVSNERHFLHQGYAAIEFQLSGPTSGAYVRYVECPGRLFSLIVEYPSGSEAEVKPLISDFFNSLRVDPMPKGGKK